MKIAVTGHTQGLGKGFVDYYRQQGHQVVGFSRSNDYDLRNWDCIQFMLDAIEDFDIFINNAKPDFAQTTILYELTKRWHNQANKQIINVGSMIVDSPMQNMSIELLEYKTQKHALETASKLISNRYPGLVMLVHPGHLYDVGRPDYTKINAWIDNFETLRQLKIRKVTLEI